VFFQRRAVSFFAIAIVACRVSLLVASFGIASSSVQADPSNSISADDAPMETPSQGSFVQPAPSLAPIGSADDNIPQNVTSALVLDECLAAETCIDRFLWVLYRRAPKLDQIEVYESRDVAVTKRGRTVIVSQRIAKPADSDFGWKDPKAATKAGMPLMDYVIGGMDRTFKSKLFYILYAAEQAGFSPGITSGFRDDYRQSIASGRKARANMSYHGGSVHGGYGHGLAADVISTKGNDRSERLYASRLLWSWIDQHAKQFGIGRPYLDYDPPHVAPIDGKEYAHHHGSGAKAHHLAGYRAHRRVAAHDRGPLKRSRTVRSAKA
jgi:hypothetical protein